MDPPSLGGRLREARKARGWTQEELACRADTSQAVIQKIENGKSLRPRKIDVIARVLDVDPAWLMFGGHRAAALEGEARELALAWQRLPADQRLLFRREILKAANGASHSSGY
ncbi:MAG: helix-turn-helix transcriptional regulator [Gammaproteobacteria bacterium]|nr:helix-turn-helix transcriptional regulator [Gammaproteobacteria bacterium]